MENIMSELELLKSCLESCVEAQKNLDTYSFELDELTIDHDEVKITIHGLKVMFTNKEKANED
jgi:hypothetical protein